MFKSSTIQENLAYISFLFSIYAFTALPFSGVIFSAICYIQFFFFSLFLLIIWDFNSIISFKIKKVSIDKFILLIIFIVLVVGVFFVNKNSNSDLKSIVKTISYFPVFFMFGIYLPNIFFKDTSKFESFLNFLVIFGIINAILGWFLIFSGLQQGGTYSAYLMGIFNHPNATGFVFSLTIPIVVYKFFFKGLKKALFLPLIFLLSISLLFTLSRAAYIATGIAVLLLSFYKSKKIFLFMVAIIIILIFTIVIDFTAMKGGLNSFSRILLFATAYDMIMADAFHFLWGYGVVNFYDTFTSEKLFVGSVEIVADPHNFILLLGIQFGMILTTLIAVYISITLIKAGRNIRKYPVGHHNRNLFVLCYSVIISLLIQNMFEDIIIYPEYYFMPLLFIYYGFLIKAYRN